MTFVSRGKKKTSTRKCSVSFIFSSSFVFFSFFFFALLFSYTDSRSYYSILSGLFFLALVISFFLLSIFFLIIFPLLVLLHFHPRFVIIYHLHFCIFSLGYYDTNVGQWTFVGGSQDPYAFVYAIAVGQVSTYYSSSAVRKKKEKRNMTHKDRTRRKEGKQKKKS